MKKIIRLVLAVMIWMPMAGCHSVTTATPPLAPGYTSAVDQTLGESLAAVNYFLNQEKTNYSTLTPTQQAAEKMALNALVTATDIANAAYVAYHSGAGSLALAQSDLTSAQNAQTALAASKGVK